MSCTAGFPSEPGKYMISADNWKTVFDIRVYYDEEENELMMDTLDYDKDRRALFDANYSGPVSIASRPKLKGVEYMPIE